MATMAASETTAIVYLTDRNSVGSPLAFQTDQDRWSAVVERDAGANGIFYYSVATTGVYCLPSCAARLALRKNVAFHNTPAEAEQAGFRACKRCRPSQAGQAGVSIRFATGECVLGTVLVAATDRGICAILFGDDSGALERELKDRFAKATMVRGDEDVAAIVTKVTDNIESPQFDFELQLDLHGTAFQQKVWQALREIPVGETASYAAVAKRIGSPTAARAVARACASNPIAIAVPCHRVVRNDGGLSGYRWGVERKQALLEREAAA